MGLFKKKAVEETALDAAPDAAYAAAASDAAPVSGGSVTAEPLPASSPVPAAASPAGSSNGRHGGVGETLHVAKEASVSGAAVAVLILWTIAVAGWTGFQVVTNGLLWAQLETLPFPKPGDPKIALNGSPGIASLEIKALWAILAIEAACIIFFLTFAVGLMWVPYIGACRQKRRARRTKRSFLPWAVTLVLVASAWFKLFTISSVLNKMAYQGTWCTSNANLDIKYTFQPQGAPPPGCSLAPQASGIRMAMVWAMLTIAFHMLMYFVRQPKGLFGKLFGLLPAILVCAFLVLKPVTSLMNWYYSQEHFTKQGNFTFTAELIVALIAFITAVWLSIFVGWAVFSLRLLPRWSNTLLGCCGRRYDDVYYEHDQEDDVASRAKSDASMEEGAAGRKPRKSYALRAATKSAVQQYYYMAQLPSVFGFVSPMITRFALGVTNWWIIFDIIVGAALIFLYMVLCGFHRKLLAPSKHVPR